MRERPIIFSGEMVRAILDGRKTQTRRVIKWGDQVDEIGSRPLPEQCKFGVAGDRLWVREKLRKGNASITVGSRKVSTGAWVYACDEAPITLPPSHPAISAMLSWAHHQDRDYCPSIHMPRWASRITLEITKVRVERLQDISREDAKSEGMSWDDSRFYNFKAAEVVYAGTQLWKHSKENLVRGAIAEYAALWDSLHGKGAWGKNPFVWVIEFRLSPDVQSTNANGEKTKPLVGAAQQEKE